jgi:predicted small lipoprotein YifL
MRAYFGNHIKIMEPIMRQMVIRSVVLLLVLLTLPACGRNGTEALQAQPTLEQQVQELQSRLDALERRHAKDVEDLRTDLKNLLTYLNIAMQNLADQKPGEGQAPPSEGKEEGSLRRSLQENLKKLLDLSREMIDRLERELDQSMRNEGRTGKQ